MVVYAKTKLELCGGFYNKAWFGVHSQILIWVFPKIGLPPKWMVKIMENPIKMDDLGVITPIFGNTHIDAQNAGFLNMYLRLQTWILCPSKMGIHFRECHANATNQTTKALHCACGTGKHQGWRFVTFVFPVFSLHLNHFFPLKFYMDTLGCPPSQHSSHHQDYYIFSRGSL